MAHSILLTGCSGYLGGALLADLQSAALPPYKHLYALVRSDAQAEAVQRYGAEPLRCALDDAVAVHEAIVTHGITVVFFLVDAVRAEMQINLIDALAAVKRETGKTVHFLHTSGAKLFSSHAGMPTSSPLEDTRPDMFELQSACKAQIPMLQGALGTNNAIIEHAEAKGVRSYIFVPCIVYGKGKGFGNPISIQTVALVRAAKAAGHVCKVDNGKPTWPVCHLDDNTSLYIRILHQILAGEEIGHGKSGYFLAASGEVAWDDLYGAVGNALAKRKVIESAVVTQATEVDLVRMGTVLGVPKEMVALQMGGCCTMTAAHGRQIGWKPRYSPEHALDAADAEVDFILSKL